MATKAMKIIRTRVKFNGYDLNEITDVGRGRQNRVMTQIVTCDSEEDNPDYLDQHIERGTIDFTMVYDGEVGGPYDSLQEDFDLATEADLEVKYRNGSTVTFLAKIAGLDTPGGAAEGGHAEYAVSFQRKGAIRRTMASEVTL